ncbi:SDR family oxidoreductase [Nocardioides dongxiaopingii]|uniref:SDR family oxidoreductase n=1 Tax=Nocardioides dongxiaopingii TaxID=2576036 RepID=UPI0010C76CBD|nr:SDR family oxidoreductase [Nocardioides dongxiaopingii]
MRVLVIGGTGLIGSLLTERLRTAGHEVTPAWPASGVDTITGTGLVEAMAGIDVVVDVTNSPVWDDDAVLDFFVTSTGNQLAAEKQAGVGHHVAVSIVGARDLPTSGYLRAKVAQEDAIAGGGVPFSVLRATQFFEFVGGIAEAGLVGDEIHLPPAPFQPVAASDVADALADVVTSAPLDGYVEVAGPELSTMAEVASRVLAARGDARPVVVDEGARYFGADVAGGALAPRGKPGHTGVTTLEQWLARA